MSPTHSVRRETTSKEEVCPGSRGPSECFEPRWASAPVGFSSGPGVLAEIKGLYGSRVDLTCRDLTFIGHWLVVAFAVHIICESHESRIL